MAKASWELNQKNERWFLLLPKDLPSDQYPSPEEVFLHAKTKNINPNSFVKPEILQEQIDKAEGLHEDVSYPIVIETSFDVRILVSKDKTVAKLYIRKASNNPSFDDKFIFDLINNSGLKEVNLEKIKESLAAFQKSSQMELDDCVIAEGKAPTRGPNRELIPKIDFLSDEQTNDLKQYLEQHSKMAMHTQMDSIFPLSSVQKIAYVQENEIIGYLSLVELGESGIDVYGKVIQGLPGNDPNIHSIENITLGPQGLKSNVTGLFLLAQKEDSVFARVIQYISGKAKIDIREDKMEASLTLISHVGAGKILTMETVNEAIKEAGIKGSINFQEIEEKIRISNSSNITQKFVILKGQKAVPANGIKIEWFVDTSKNPVVTAQDIILSYEPITKGLDGYDVVGNTLPASEAKQESIPVFDPTISEELEGNKHIFKALVSGELQITDKLSISNTMKLNKDIDKNTNDVFFPGNLELTGNIATGRSVKTSGYLNIIGDAEASLLYAETNLTMNGGIKGKGRGTVWSKQDMTLSFAENARLLAGQNIHIDNYCFQCIVKTNGTLFMRGYPGVLLGGMIQASKGLEVKDLGSAKLIRTLISFGQNYLVKDQIEVCEKEAAQIKEKIEKLNNVMQTTDKNDPQIHELRRRKIELLKRNDKLTVRIFTLKEQFESHIISHIRVEGTVYPGVVLESHGRYFEVRKKMQHVLFIFDQTNGQITCNPIAEGTS